MATIMAILNIRDGFVNHRPLTHIPIPMSPDRRCPNCEGTMQVGFIPDATYGSNVVAGWYPGIPQKSFWQGTKVDREDMVALDAYRCQRCGFVELYAIKSAPPR